jgi:hypothetical protein
MQAESHHFVEIGTGHPMASSFPLDRVILSIPLASRGLGLVALVPKQNAAAAVKD